MSEKLSNKDKIAPIFGIGLILSWIYFLFSEPLDAESPEVLILLLTYLTMHLWSIIICYKRKDVVVLVSGVTSFVLFWKIGFRLNLVDMYSQIFAITSLFFYVFFNFENIRYIVNSSNFANLKKLVPVNKEE